MIPIYALDAARSLRSLPPSTCPSSTSPLTGGTRCTRVPPSLPKMEKLPFTDPCCGLCLLASSPSPCSSFGCCARGIDLRSYATRSITRHSTRLSPSVAVRGSTDGLRRGGILLRLWGVSALRAVYLVARTTCPTLTYHT